MVGTSPIWDMPFWTMLLPEYIFSIEDMYSGSNIVQNGMSQMGLVPTIGYDGNILISPGLGTTDENGALLIDRARIAARATVKVVEVVSKYAGLLEREPVAG